GQSACRLFTAVITNANFPGLVLGIDGICGTASCTMDAVDSGFVFNGSMVHSAVVDGLDDVYPTVVKSTTDWSYVRLSLLVYADCLYRIVVVLAGRFGPVLDRQQLDHDSATKLD